MSDHLLFAAVAPLVRVTAGRTIREASALAEELEKQARLYFLLGDRGKRLTQQIAVLRPGSSR